MNKLSVEGHPDLYRDPKTGAIINNNTNEYESYIKTYRARNMEKQKLNTMESDLNQLKSEISEIKNLLSQLLSK
jgi:hypothetical protein